MTFTEIQTAFSLCKSWEERYRLLVKLSRELPKPSETELAELPEIHGCESRLWFKFSPETKQIQAYSDARLMQGLLVIVSAFVQAHSDLVLKELDLTVVFEQLQISKNLTSTRLNGIKQLGEIIRQAE